jgi:hypothetical protein
MDSSNNNIFINGTQSSTTLALAKLPLNGYTVYVKAKVGGVSSLSSNVVTIILLRQSINTTVLNTTYIVPPHPNTNIKYTLFKNITIGESQDIMYVLCTYTDIYTTTAYGSSIYLFNYMKYKVEKLYDFYSATENQFSGLIYYNGRLYTCDRNSEIKVMNVTTKTVTKYMNVPSNINSLHLDSSGNMFFLCNRNIYKINLQTNPTSATLGSAIYTIPSTYTVYSDSIVLDNSENIYFATSTTLEKVAKTSSGYGIITKIYDGNYIGFMKSDGINLFINNGRGFVRIPYATPSATSRYALLEYPQDLAITYSNTIVFNIDTVNFYGYRI